MLGKYCKTELQLQASISILEPDFKLKTSLLAFFFSEN
jgi:hypothetical protein